jgi:hypothetical protein
MSLQTVAIESPFCGCAAYCVQDVGPTHFVNASVSDKVYAPMNPPVVVDL